MKKTLLLISFTAVLLSACSFLPFADHAIIQSQNDAREYQSLTLKNGLQVLLVSDAEADFSAASLDVFVGSGDDPVHRQGLAHFLEHMLFLGTKKYPEADAYQAFIKEHGGTHNAYTSFEHTNYFFTVRPDSLQPALDRFAQFFISPLFDEAYVEREKHAVNAEYKARIQNESRRHLDVLKTLVNPAHDFAKFSVGNLDTLSSAEQPIRDDLLAFYHKHYAASNMRLVVYGSDSLQQLQQWVTAQFSAVPDFKVVDETSDTPLFVKGYLPKWVKVKPHQTIRELTLFFPLPDQQPYYHSKPLTLIGHLLGHEGAGSLFSYLKQRNWAESLSAGQGIHYQGGSSFSITIELTDEGLLHQQQIVRAVFEAIARLQQTGIPRWVFDEVAQVNRMGFEFQESVDPQHYVMRLANALHYYPVEEVLVADYLLDTYAPEHIDQLLGRLTLDNCLLSTITDDFTAEATSPFYATPYRVDALSDDFQRSIASVAVNPAITLPAPNDLLAENTDMVAPLLKDSTPRKIFQQEGAVLWYKGIDRFTLPKATAYYSFQNDVFRQGVEQAVLLDLYVALLNDNLNEWLYPARMAGLGFRLYGHQRGISLKLNGFNDKQGELLTHIATQIKHASFDKQQFARIQAELMRNRQNAQMQPPYIKLGKRWHQQMQVGVFSEEEKLAALVGLSLADVQKFAEQYWRNIHIVAMNSGNVTPSQSKAMLNQLLTVFTVESGRENPLAVYRLGALRGQQSVDSGHKDSGYLLYWQAGDNSLSSQANWMLMGKVLEGGFFNQLRTQQQLGYIVYERYVPLLTVPGLLFAVQSPKADVAQIHGAVQDYLKEAEQTITQLTQAQFDSYRAGLIQQLQERPKTLQQESDGYWYELALALPAFNQDLQLATQMQQLTLSAWRKQMLAVLGGAPTSQLLLHTGDKGMVDGFESINSLQSQSGLMQFTYP